MRDKVKECHECGSDDLEWYSACTTKSNVQDGRLRLNEVTITYFLGCNSCSETLIVKNEDQMLTFINGAYFN